MGGQSVPSLDYYLAPGVLKTYKKKFRDNLKKYIEVKFDLDDGAIGAIYESVISKYGEIKTVKFSDEGKHRLHHILEEVIYSYGVETDKDCETGCITKMIEFVLEKSYKETNKQTYQAMEAMVHNLNTMNVRHVG